MSVAQKEARKIIAEIVDKQAAYLVDVSFSERGRQRFLKVIVQSLTGITLDEIARITRDINNNETLDRLFPDGFQLEVSSPGIDQKLREYRDFPRNLGRMLQIYHHAERLESPLTGKLVEVTQSQLVVEVHSARHEFSFDELEYARVIVKC
jgi:ribosome maturation factor RimP